MNTTTKSTLALVLAVSTGFAASAGAAEERSPVTCHGKVATFVGSESADVLTGRDVDFGRNPVIVLGGGNDELKLGSSYYRASVDSFSHGASGASVDSLTVCAGDGNDEVEVFENIGARSEIILDGGLGNDFVGNNGSSVNGSDIATMQLIGGDGNDTLRGANSDDRMSAGRGRDTVYGVGGNDTLSGGAGPDEIHGERGGDRMMGGQGADLLDGDIPKYGEGEDFANGGSNRDRCEAETKMSCEN